MEKKNWPKIESSWLEILKDEFNQPYFLNLIEQVKKAYQISVCFPRGNQIFAAFDACPFEKVRVVIIGQDPYHGPGQANGLSFSVNEGIPFPPSLINIFKEIQQDLGIQFPPHGDLSRWAKQGVLLLNSTLTVEHAKPKSHAHFGWELFTDAAIRQLNSQRTGLVFMLWGADAKRKGAQIDQRKHLVLTSGHPSPMSANRGHWFGNKHFSKANQYLQNQGFEAIAW